MRPLRCLLGHQWRTTGGQSIRYGVLITERCRRCGKERTFAGWRQ